MPGTHPDPPPELPGIKHEYVTTPGGVTIHVAEAGPSDGAAVMLVHGFPQHWWEWRHQIGPLAADGHRVLVPDLRGAGWSDAPRGRYSKAEMADDLLAVRDGLGVERAWIAAHDWGGLAGPDSDAQLYLNRLKDPARAHAGSMWYRTFQTPEFLSWIGGEYDNGRVEIPLRWVTGLKDPVITPTMHPGYENHASDVTFEHVPDVGHWIVEQAHGLVLDRLRSFLND